MFKHPETYQGPSHPLGWMRIALASLLMACGTKNQVALPIDAGELDGGGSFNTSDASGHPRVPFDDDYELYTGGGPRPIIGKKAQGSPIKDLLSSGQISEIRDGGVQD